jgi:RNA polymerase sigma factor (sigma-70 family)
MPQAQAQAQTSVQTRDAPMPAQPGAPAARMPKVVPLPRRHPRREPHAMNGAATAAVLPLRPNAACDDAEAEAESFDPLEPPDDTAADEPRALARTKPATPTGAVDDAVLVGWLAGIGRQEHRALEALYDHTASRVHGFVLRIVGHTAAAEEVVEDTYWQLWRQAPRFDASRGRPLTWLLAIARSRAIDHLRREQRFVHDELPDDDTLAQQAGTLSTEAQLATQQSTQALHGALALLPARERQLVSLAFLRGFTHEEIASSMALPLGTVKSLIRRALLQLRQHLGAHHAPA